MENYQCQSFCADVWYIGTIYILFVPVEVDFQKHAGKFDTGNSFLPKQICILGRARYTNSFSSEIFLGSRCP